MKKKLKLLFLLFLALLALFLAFLFVPFPNFRAETRYEVIDIGTLPGENQSMASDINNHGQIVGSSGGSAFLWDTQEGMKKIGDQFWDCKINERGEVLGSMVIANASGITEDHLVLIDSTGQFIDLDSCLRGRSFDFNLKGEIVWADFDSSKSFHSFVRNATGETSEIDLEGYTEERVTSLNENGVALGITKDASGTFQTFLLDSHGNLEWLNPDTTLKKHFLGNIVNDEGWVVGEFYTTIEKYDLILWDGDSFSQLPTLGSGAFINSTDMNNLNQIVGISLTFQAKIKNRLIDGVQSVIWEIPYGLVFEEMLGITNWQPVETRAVLWDDGEIFYLNSLIPPDSDWNLIQASAINDKGEIVGWGYHGEGNHPKAFLLRPIEKE